MVDRSKIHDAIVLADRGYESYYDFAHIERRGWNYLIRVKDSPESTGILSGLKTPACDEFDVHFRRILTRRQTNKVKANKDIYRFLPSNVVFDFLPLRSKELYPMAFRVVRFQLAEDCFETVITNLSAIEFPVPELKALYAKRWGIETSFRELKYAVGLVNFHGKKRDYVIQEVFARLITYNFSGMITMHIVIRRAHSKHAYQVNFTVAIHICRQFLRCFGSVITFDVEGLIEKTSCLYGQIACTSARSKANQQLVLFIALRESYSNNCSD